MSLRAHWFALVNVLSDVAPATAATLRAPVSPQIVASVERATLPWPAELTEFFSLHNGQRDAPGMGSVLPTGRLIGVEEIVDNGNPMIEVMAELVADDVEYYEAAYPEIVASYANAGIDTDDHLFLPGYIPITKWDSNYTYCDARLGERRGCVSHRDKEGGHLGQPSWSSLTDMTIELRESLLTGRSVGWYTPRPVDGALHWEIEC